METVMPIHSSMLVYLFADQFSEPLAGVTMPGVIAPQTGTKLDPKPLVIRLYLSALFELLEMGVIRLERTEENLALTDLRAPVQKISGLAWQIVRSLQAAETPAQRSVREVITRVIGGPASTYYPWLVALAWTLGEAEAFGYIQRSEKTRGQPQARFNPTEYLTQATAVMDCVRLLQPELAAAQSRLLAFEQSLGTSALVLRQAIEQGIAECELPAGAL